MGTQNEGKIMCFTDYSAQAAQKKISEKRCLLNIANRMLKADIFP
jgi:hypothetical protein